MTIKDIAKKAGVSIATVSHVVNKTRYVSPELVEKIESIIDSLDEKPAFVKRSLSKKNEKQIACFIDDFSDEIITQIINSIKISAQKKGYHVCVCENPANFMVHEMAECSGIIYASSSEISSKLIKSTKFGNPSVMVGYFADTELRSRNDIVLIDYRDQVAKAVRHLARLGHEDIRLINGGDDSFAETERNKALIEALRENAIPFNEEMILNAASIENDTEHRLLFRKILGGLSMPTAVICSSVDLTVSLLKYMRRRSIKCPEDISILTFSENVFNDLISPSLTTVCFDAKKIGEAAFEQLYSLMNGKALTEQMKIESKILVRESTQSIGRGPRGEKAESIKTVSLSDKEAETLKNSNFTAVLAFHHSGTAWSNIHEKAIKDMFLSYGIKILAVTDAHYDPEIQIRQLESIISMNPDILISVPTDELRTSEAYKAIAHKKIKIIFINNVPADFEDSQYVTCISVNERENGRNAGEALGEYMVKNDKKKAGFIIHGVDFFATKQRDMVAQQVLSEGFDVEIADVRSFCTEDKAYDVTLQMITENPGIEALYVSWSIPAMEAMRALKHMHREDIGIVSADLDLPVAESLVLDGTIKAITAQRLHKQGEVIARAASCALLNKTIPKYIGVNPYKVTHDNLLTAWCEIMGSNPPDELVNMIKP